LTHGRSLQCRKHTQVSEDCRTVLKHSNNLVFVPFAGLFKDLLAYLLFGDTIIFPASIELLRA
jgi:hypothetical protein